MPTTTAAKRVRGRAICAHSPPPAQMPWRLVSPVRGVRMTLSDTQENDIGRREISSSDAQWPKVSRRHPSLNRNFLTGEWTLTSCGYLDKILSGEIASPFGGFCGGRGGKQSIAEADWSHKYAVTVIADGEYEVPDESAR